jgi:hypothetical protein
MCTDLKWKLRASRNFIMLLTNERDAYHDWHIEEVKFVSLEIKIKVEKNAI